MLEIDWVSARYPSALRKRGADYTGLVLPLAPLPRSIIAWIRRPCGDEPFSAAFWPRILLLSRLITSSPSVPRISQRTCSLRSNNAESCCDPAAPWTGW